MEISYWEQDSFWGRAEVVIVGAGIVGLNAAIDLKTTHPNWRIVVLDRGVLPLGASTRNAGFACFGSITELAADLQHHDMNTVMALVALRWQGLQRLRERVGDAALRYVPCGGYELLADTNALARHAPLLKTFNAALHDLTGLEETFVLRDEAINRLGLGKVKHLVLNRAEGQLHPGEMMRALLRMAQGMGVQVQLGTAVTTLHDEAPHGATVILENGIRLAAERVLVTTNGFTRRLLPAIAVQPARNQVLLTAPIQGLRVRGTFHAHEGYFYFRDVGDRILVGGGRHLAEAEEITDAFGATARIQGALLDFLRETILPQHEDVTIDHRWSGILGVGAQKTPIVQMVSPSIGVAVRMGGMGVAIGSMIGAQGAALIAQHR